MHMLNFVKFNPFIPKILSGNEILTQVKGNNSFRKYTNQYIMIPTQILALSMDMQIII